MKSERTAGKAMVVLDAQQASGLRSAVEQWSGAKVISSQLAQELLSTIEVKERGFDWEKFAKYSFRLAVLCVAVAVISLVFDDLFLKLAKRILAIPPPLRAAFTATVAIAVHIWALRRSRHMPQQVYFNEAIHGIGAVLFALAALQLGEAIKHQFQLAKQSMRDEKDSQQGSPLPEHQRRSSYKEARDHRDAMVNLVILMLAMVYGAVGVVAKSNFIWSCGMITLAGYLGAQSGYFWGTYFLGISHPIKFICVGASLLGMAYFMPASAITAPLYKTTRIWGLLYVFMPIWILSIFGLEIKTAEDVSLIRRFVSSEAFWSVAFLAAAVLSVCHGLSYNVSTTKGFGLTFIAINLYTKFFEICWDNLYKPLFFTILAITLAVVGQNAEAIWNLKIQDAPITV